MLVEILIIYIASFQRPTDETKNLYDAVLGISGIQFVNLGLMLMIIGLKTPLPDSLFEGKDGEYIMRDNEISVYWYYNFGSYIIQSFMLELIFPHIMPTILVVYFWSRRWYDRHWT